MAPQGELERVGGEGGVAHSEQLEVRGAPRARLERVGAAPLPQLERVEGGEGGVAPPTQLERVGGGVGEGTPQSLENKEQRK